MIRLFSRHNGKRIKIMQPLLCGDKARAVKSCPRTPNKGRILSILSGRVLGAVLIAAQVLTGAEFEAVNAIHH